MLTELAAGMRFLAEHIAALETSARELRSTESPRGVEAIRVIADEEAGKFLILLDAARCAYEPAKVRTEQLKRCSSHLAKGIYARAAELRPADFAEVQRFVKRLRLSHYLDGPNDVDWIFRNEIVAEREERLYVDYVETDDGESWITPQFFDDVGPRITSGAVELGQAISRVGMCETDALQTVADVWRGFAPEPETHWRENQALVQATLERVVATEQAEQWIDGDVQRIMTCWMFPLHAVDMSLDEQDLDRLRERQEEWDPDGYGTPWEV